MIEYEKDFLSDRVVDIDGGAFSVGVFLCVSEVDE